jgi:hypothetical protein
VGRPRRLLVHTPAVHGRSVDFRAPDDPQSRRSAITRASLSPRSHGHSRSTSKCWREPGGVPPRVFGLPLWRVLPFEVTIAVARERPCAGRTAVAPNATEARSRWLRNFRSPIRSVAKIDNALYPGSSGCASSSASGGTSRPRPTALWV